MARRLKMAVTQLLFLLPYFSQCETQLFYYFMAPYGEIRGHFQDKMVKGKYKATTLTSKCGRVAKYWDSIHQSVDHVKLPHSILVILDTRLW